MKDMMKVDKIADAVHDCVQEYLLDSPSLTVTGITLALAGILEHKPAECPIELRLLHAAARTWLTYVADNLAARESEEEDRASSGKVQ